MHVILRQVQFPALDIRLSYNDIQLFLAIAKSIPTASTPLPSEYEPDPSARSELTAAPRDHWRQKTEALTGMQRPVYGLVFIPTTKKSPLLFGHSCYSVQRQ